MTAPTIDPGDQEQAEQKPARLTTGVPVDCPCGASGVPMAWGSGRTGAIKLYRHVVGRPYAGKRAYGDKCSGPRDLFSHLLRESKLMLADRGTRCMTYAEHAEHKRFADEFSDRLPPGEIAEPVAAWARGYLV